MLRAATSDGPAPAKLVCEALALGRAACLEGDANEDGLLPLGAAKGRWMTAEMHEAYLVLAEMLCDERSPARHAAALRAVLSLSPRTAALGIDRYASTRDAPPPRPLTPGHQP